MWGCGKWPPSAAAVPNRLQSLPRSTPRGVGGTGWADGISRRIGVGGRRRQRQQRRDGHRRRAWPVVHEPHPTPPVDQPFPRVDGGPVRSPPAQSGRKPNHPSNRLRETSLRRKTPLRIVSISCFVSLPWTFGGDWASRPGGRGRGHGTGGHRGHRRLRDAQMFRLHRGWVAR